MSKQLEGLPGWLKVEHLVILELIGLFSGGTAGMLIIGDDLWSAITVPVFMVALDILCIVIFGRSIIGGYRVRN